MANIRNHRQTIAIDSTDTENIIKYHEILFSDKWEWTTDTCDYLRRAQGIMLREESQSQKITYCMTIYNILKMIKLWRWRRLVVPGVRNGASWGGGTVTRGYQAQRRWASSAS